VRHHPAGREYQRGDAGGERDGTADDWGHGPKSYRWPSRVRWTP
jgi:hypothetical protein